MALKLLLVDPDEEWLTDTKKYLQENMYKVETVNNGRDAQLALYNEKYFAVVMNNEVSNHNALQVLKWVKSNRPSQMIVMVVENTPEADRDERLTTSALKKMGIKEVLEKPFEQADLRKALEDNQNLNDLVTNLKRREGASDEVEVSDSDDSFSEIKIGEFYSSKAVLFDIYIKLTVGRYIKILHLGDTFSKERIDKYKNEKNLEFLYFKKSDLRKYVHYQNHLTKKTLKNENVSAEIKVKLLKNTSIKYLESLYTEGLKPQVIEQGKEVVKNVFELVETDDSLYKLLRSYQDFDPSGYDHSYLVTLFSSSIIKMFEWQSKVTIEATALACLFHDIGKMKLDKSLLEMKVKDMSQEQRDEYRKHPELGVEMLAGNRLVGNSVRQIILQHHEHFDGTGFPTGQRGIKILTLSNIVCIANDFVHLMMDEDIKPIEALKKMLSDEEMVVRYNSLIVENFIKVFADPKKMKKKFVLPSNSRVLDKKAS